ncbi:MAG: hypothetical protein K6E13_00045 [Lachnospiraceae bacterium]|nr:hypothetical protein [Lachnospiraceae bacterium]
MNISGIRPGSGFYDYSIAHNSELRSQQVQMAKSAEFANLEAEPENKQLNIEVSTGNVQTAPEQSFTSLDYASQYQPDTTYEMKGADSDLRSLDMEQAISDMQKDKLIQQYQFFVGEAQTSQALGQEAPVARAMENFDF